MLQKIFAKKPCKYKQIRSDQIPASVNVLKHCRITQYILRWNEITLQKYIKTPLSPKKGDIQTTLVFNISKTYQNDQNFLSFKITLKYAQLYQFSI